MNHGFGGAPGDAGINEKLYREQLSDLFLLVYHYHSVYDTERWVELYADPGFFRHVCISISYGLLMIVTNYVYSA